MSKRSRQVLIYLVMAIVLATAGTVAWNWESSLEYLDEKGRETERALFRLGELGSIGAEIEREYGIRPEMAYEAEDRGRVLSMVFHEHEPPADTSAERHARKLALFAKGKTEKHDQIDRIEVHFRGAAQGEPPGPPSYSFGPADLVAERSTEAAGSPGEAGL